MIECNRDKYKVLHLSPNKPQMHEDRSCHSPGLWQSRTQKWWLLVCPVCCSTHQRLKSCQESRRVELEDAARVCSISVLSAVLLAEPSESSLSCALHWMVDGVLGTALEGDILGFRSQPLCTQATWPQANYLTSLICKIVLMRPTSKDC